ncbi:hypothetical protein [Streptomyces sp. NPDC007991]|uniref:hypothetical protein n=1 Tax=Streptomyces sp. NPDC007991 TaxID=3364803 RepID=UPI0036E8592B
MPHAPKWSPASRCASTELLLVLDRPDAAEPEGVDTLLSGRTPTARSYASSTA